MSSRSSGWAWRRAARGLALLCLSGVAPLYLATPGSAQQAASDPCEAAETRAREEPPSVVLLRELARCRLQAQRPPAAVEALDAARLLAPDDPELAFELAVALYHAGELERSDRVLRVAEAGLPERADLLFYRGMLAHQRGDHRVAARALDRARRLDPGGVEPVASYHAGLSYVELGERARAEEALSRVAHDWPGTLWSSESDRALRGLRRVEVPFHWLVLDAGIEFDDNVVLRANRVQSEPGEGGDADWRGVWNMSAGAELLRAGRFKGGIAGSYDAGIHRDLGGFDWHQPGLTLWLDRPLLPDLRLRLQYDFAHAWLDDDPYLSSHDIALILAQDWGRPGETELLLDGYVYEFHFSPRDVVDGSGPPAFDCGGLLVACGPPGLDEGRERDRDGQGFRLDLLHALTPVAGGPELRLGYTFDRFDARGREYSFSAHVFRAGLHVALPAGLIGDLLVAYAFEPYRGASTYPDPDKLVSGQQYALPGNDRTDDVLRLRIELEWPLGLGFSVLARWAYTDQDSNVEVFSYRRHVVGLRFRFTHAE